MTHIQVTFDDPVGDRYEKVNALAFSLSNAAMETALIEWKKRLTTLLKEAGTTDKEALKIVESYIEKTEKVIQAVNNASNLNQNDGEQANTIRAKELIEAIESFEQHILKLSETEASIAAAAVVFLAAVAFVATLLIMVFTLLPIMAVVPFTLLLIFLLAAACILTGTIGYYCASNAIGADAVEPKMEDVISTKLTEFGIFGNTLKHKARNLLDAIREEKNQEASVQPVLPQPAVLTPVYGPS